MLRLFAIIVRKPILMLVKGMVLLNYYIMCHIVLKTLIKKHLKGNKP